MRARFMPFCTMPMKMAPSTTLPSRPEPPRRLTPPMTQAAIDSSGIVAPILASPVSRRAVSMMPEMAVSALHST